ncbi:hypothetical protein C8J98_102548 [Luteibacter sp. OK325]|uniref:hypothetical protein n=1 Tax=Luteibacter sp. OK325 TaxID=2135670 RepID=UPI000D3CEE39|nr:hypothetical protein [Luteibacter sp. OK325]PTR34360.1 hypothetical protein C8J98_102548 [Luteibacter sp. OK325]
MDIEARLARLEARNTKLTVICGVLATLCMALGTTFAVAGPDATQPGVIHAKGLVIDDANGHPRILIGAPFPDVPGRIRHDERSMAMLFLDEQGHDRLTVGQAMTPQIKGKVPAQFHRIGDSVGVTIHDLDGNERGGMAWLSNGRGAIAFDYPERDAIGMYVDDKDRSATFVLENPDVSVGDRSLLELTARGKGGELRLFDGAGKVRTRWSLTEGRIDATKP